jgi:hypothetical protein
MLMDALPAFGLRIGNLYDTAKCNKILFERVGWRADLRINYRYAY